MILETKGVKWGNKRIWKIELMKTFTGYFSSYFSYTSLNFEWFRFLYYNNKRHNNPPE